MKSKIIQLIKTEGRLVVARGWGRGGVGKTGEGGERVQASSYKINKLWGSNIQPGDYS